MKVFYLLLSILLLTFNLKAQTQKILSSYIVTVIDNDSIIKASVSNNKSKITTEPDKIYYWYGNNKIGLTQGGYSGKLLDGEINCTSKDGKLFWSGYYLNGIKNGKWKQWNSNGNLISINNYKSGKLNGESFYYSQEGKIILQGNYRNDKKDGDWKTINNDGTFTIEKFKDGIVVIKEEKKNNNSEKEKHRFSLKNLFKSKSDKTK